MLQEQLPQYKVGETLCFQIKIFKNLN